VKGLYRLAKPTHLAVQRERRKGAKFVQAIGAIFETLENQL
jgi:hypothetical protein